MKLDQLVNDSRAKAIASGSLLAAVIALNVMTWSMRDKVSDLATAVVKAQESQRHTDTRVEALELRVLRLEDRYHAHIEVFAATIAQWKEAMRRWEDTPPALRGRR